MVADGGTFCQCDEPAARTVRSSDASSSTTRRTVTLCTTNNDASTTTQAQGKHQDVIDDNQGQRQHPWRHRQSSRFINASAVHNRTSTTSAWTRRHIFKGRMFELKTVHGCYFELSLQYLRLLNSHISILHLLITMFY